MNDKPLHQAAVADAFERALAITGELTCEQAQTLLPAFVAAERAGVDVDSVPAYAALLRHLDESPPCAEIYAALADQLEALEGPAEQFAPANVALPRFFETTGENPVVRVLKGLTTRFGLRLDRPEIGPAVSMMGSGMSIPLFSSTLDAVDGSPSLEVTLYPYSEPPEVVVAVREQRTVNRWQIQLRLADQIYTALTDEQGEARLSGFSEEQLRAADPWELLCTAVPEDDV